MMRALAIAVLMAAGCSGSEPPGSEPDADPGGSDAAVDAAGDPADAGGFPAPVLDECVTDGSAGEHTFSCAGLTYDVSIPPACLARACGLVVDVHGYSMSGQMQDNNTRMRALGREHGLIVVQPNAEPDPPLSDWNAADDDDVLAFVERVAAAFHVDARRWYFTGFSQGGFMSWRFVCKYADRFAAIAPAAGCSAGGINACVLDQVGALPGETNILYMHGSEDTIVASSCIDPQRDAVLAAYEMTGEEVVSDDAMYTRTRWTNPRGITFELLEHDYASDNDLIRGHCFPGSADQGGEPGQVASFACGGGEAFDWGTTAVQFFLAHERE